jgi:hypothetical protein
MSFTISNERFAFFGASVTEQKNGYAIQFIKQNKCLNYNIFGYGSRHLNNAGICYIDDVIRSNPSYCFIDWFNTGYICYNEDKFNEIKIYINTIVHKLLYNKIVCIFLFFPNTSISSITNVPIDQTNMNIKLANYADEINIPYINLSNIFTESLLKQILNDGIHTTDYGSEIYAKYITKLFIENIYLKYKIPDKYPEKTKYHTIHNLKVNAICDKIIFNGVGEIISIEQLIGPYSGLLKLNEKIINNWDRWCYYERLSNNINIEVKDEVTIECLQDEFDRSLCKHSIIWSNKKYLNIKSVFYIGEINVLNYNSL